MTGRPTIIVVGLGPSGPALLTAETRALVEGPLPLVLRTRRHPAVEDPLFDDVASFDGIYESSTTLDEVYRRIVDDLVWRAGERTGPALVYAVPGSPLVAERSVELLRVDPRVEVDLRPALSFLDLAWARLGVDPVAAGVQVVDGQRFEVDAAGSSGPLLVAQCDSSFVLSGIKLALADAIDASRHLGGGLARRPGGEDGGDVRAGRGFGVVDAGLQVTVLQRLGLDDERVIALPWADLDRRVEPDHLTSVWIPELAAPVAGEVQRFAELVGTLRRECPWDREQTHQSLRRHLLEESYEVLDAIDAIEPAGTETATGRGASTPAIAAAYEHLEEELGDLLFQIVFHSTLAAEAGQFTLADVARTVHDKLYSRHPHVFGEIPEGLTAADSPEGVMANWEQLKKAEKGRASVFDGIPSSLPALLHALKVQKKAASLGELGTDLPAPASWDPVVTAAQRDPTAATVGDLLFAVVNLARHASVDPEAALRAASIRYRDDIRRLEG